MVQIDTNLSEYLDESEELNQNESYQALAEDFETGTAKSQIETTLNSDFFNGLASAESAKEKPEKVVEQVRKEVNKILALSQSEIVTNAKETQSSPLARIDRKLLQETGFTNLNNLDNLKRSNLDSLRFAEFELKTLIETQKDTLTAWEQNAVNAGSLLDHADALAGKSKFGKLKFSGRTSLGATLGAAIGSLGMNPLSIAVGAAAGTAAGAFWANRVRPSKSASRNRKEFEKFNAPFKEKLEDMFEDLVSEATLRKEVASRRTDPLIKRLENQLSNASNPELKADRWELIGKIMKNPDDLFGSALDNDIKKLFGLSNQEQTKIDFLSAIRENELVGVQGNTETKSQTRYENQTENLKNTYKGLDELKKLSNFQNSKSINDYITNELSSVPTLKKDHEVKPESLLSFLIEDLEPYTDFDVLFKDIKFLTPSYQLAVILDILVDGRSSDLNTNKLLDETKKQLKAYLQQEREKAGSQRRVNEVLTEDGVKDQLKVLTEDKGLNNTFDGHLQSFQQLVENCVVAESSLHEN